MMDDFKIENFHREYPDTAFPAYQVLTRLEVDSVADVIRANLAIDLHSTYAYSLMEQYGAVHVEGVNANSDQAFDLAAVFHRLGIRCDDAIHICWCEIKDREVGRMFLSDLFRYWDDLWYPNDDILLFDQSCLWLLGIDADGYVYYLDTTKG
jgi:hypothetical protein